MTSWEEQFGRPSGVYWSYYRFIGGLFVGGHIDVEPRGEIVSQIFA